MVPAVITSTPIVTLVDRDSGRAHSRVIAKFDFNTIGDLLTEAVSPKANLNTDQAQTYVTPGPLVHLAYVVHASEALAFDRAGAATPA